MALDPKDLEGKTLEKNEAALTSAVSVIIQEEKSVEIDGLTIELIEVRPNQKQVWGMALLKLTDGTEMERRILLLDEAGFDEDQTVQDLLDRAVNAVKTMAEGGLMR